MTNTYNKGFHAGVRIGNWKEEEALEAFTNFNHGEHFRDGQIPNSLRVINHSEQGDPKSYKSTCTDAFPNPYLLIDTPRKKREIRAPPRIQIRLKAYESMLAENQRALLERQAKENADVQYDTTANVSFSSYDVDQMNSAILVRHPKPSSSVPHLVEHLTKKDFPVSDYLNDNTITIYNQQESNKPTKKDFKRRTEFTNPNFMESHGYSVKSLADIKIITCPDAQHVGRLQWRLKDVLNCQTPHHKKTMSFSDALFAYTDSSTNFIDADILKNIFKALGCPVTPMELMACVNTLGANENGGWISKKEAVSLFC